MKIAPINNNYSNYGNHNCNTVKNPNFKGMWDETVYSNEYNQGWSWAYECDLINDKDEITYYPFADETKAQIDEEIKKKKEELKLEEQGIGVCVVPLLVTAKEYAAKIQEFTTRLVKDTINNAEHTFREANVEKIQRSINYARVLKKLK